MPIKTFRFMIVLFVTAAVFGRMCIAGTWIDDFSDPTLRDWEGGLKKTRLAQVLLAGISIIEEKLNGQVII